MIKPFNHRFWSMVWVIVGHSYLSILEFGPFISNPLYFGDIFADKSMRLIFNATESVDSFFMIGGIIWLNSQDKTPISFRFWSMVWVIVGHSYLSMVMFGPFVSNPIFIGDIYDDTSMRLIFNATESVDSFFMIGGIIIWFLNMLFGFG